MKKILFITSDGTHIVGYTEFPIPEEIPGNQYLLEVDEEVLSDYLHYKIVDGALVQMTDEEYEELYPSVDPVPTAEEKQMDFNIEMDYRVSCIELGIY